MRSFEPILRWILGLAARAAARKKYEATIYFEGPMTLWAGKVHEDDVICRRRFRSMIFAETWARSRLKDFKRCNFTISEVAR